MAGKIESIDKASTLDSQMKGAVGELAKRFSQPEVAEMALMHVIRPDAASAGGYESLVQAELYRILVGGVLGADVGASVEYRVAIEERTQETKWLDIVLVDRKSGRMASIELSHNNVGQLHNRHKPCEEEYIISGAVPKIPCRYYLHVWTCISYVQFSADAIAIAWPYRDTDKQRRKKAMTMDENNILLRGDSCTFCHRSHRVSLVGDKLWEGKENEFSVGTARKGYNIKIQSGFALYKNSRRSR